MSETNAILAQEFYNNFQTRRHGPELSLRLKNARADEFDALSREIFELRRQLIDATLFLPSYDQRQYETQLHEWEQSLDEMRRSYAPKAKFTFKRKEGKTHAAASRKPVDFPSVMESIPIPSTYLSLSSHSQSRLSFSSIPDSREIPESDMTIADLDNCIVDLVGQSTGPTLTAVYVRNVANTMLVLPLVKGSVLLHDLRRCVVIVGCHQFRMHTSTNVDVYLATPSNPVIEHCSGIRFTPYPSSLSEQLQGTSSESNPLSVQDFSHIRTGQSPNWSISTGNIVLNDWLEACCPCEEILDDALKKLLPAPI